MDTSTEVEILRAKVRDLETTLKQNDQSTMVTFCLTPSLNNIFGLLLALPLVTPEIIQQRLEIATEAKVAMHRLRKHLHSYGIEVQSKRKIGYWLDPETKDKVRRIVEGKAPLLATLVVALPH